MLLSTGALRCLIAWIETNCQAILGAASTYERYQGGIPIVIESTYMKNARISMSSTLD